MRIDKLNGMEVFNIVCELVIPILIFGLLFAVGKYIYNTKLVNNNSRLLNPMEYLPVEEDDRGTYIFNSKDLCMVDKIPDLVSAGINSFKVEGRMKTNLYVAVTARTYREAIDDYFESVEKYEAKIEHYKEEISACTMRDFTRGFYYGKPSEEDQIYDNNTYIRNAVYMGRVDSVNEDGSISIMQKNKFSVGDEIEVMLYNGKNLKTKVSRIVDEYGRDAESAPHPKEKLKVWLEAIDGGAESDDTSTKIKTGMILRTIVND